MTVNDTYEATYAIPMHCESCVGDIKACLKDVPGIDSLNFDIDQQIMSVESSVAPSTIINALQRCGKDAIIRGAGEPNSSAVAILETFQKYTVDKKKDTAVRGLARIVQVGEHKTLFDITVNGVPEAGKYHASIHEKGDISKGVKSTGKVWHKFDEPIECFEQSDLGENLYSGKTFLSAPLPTWQLIGRSFIISKALNHPENESSSIKDYSFVGVIARSAGVWENNKQVCACTGKTVWEERKDALANNIK
ncbi:ccs1p [Saccharomyces arboricola H-6]|uniref:Superoxide dismutase 1 copper chaperone n=1 Tax=Saccharomyces arboricola (strain H-6 / AS 2.3317 / CBS 10644) TaxID=1160507 RepID=J8Q1B7_SACAR|nr:ccs1p [Saccharomyces arboricola H-6]